MGRVRGAIKRYERDADGLSPPERGLLDALAAAYPEPVHAGSLVMLSTGVMAKPARAAVAVSQLRARLGDGWIETVGDGSGRYRAGTNLLRSRGLVHDPAGELVREMDTLRRILDRLGVIADDVRGVRARVSGSVD